MKIGNTARITDSKTFLHNYFYSNDLYPADQIEKNVDPFVIQVCVDSGLIIKIEKDNMWMYQITENGKEQL